MNHNDISYIHRNNEKSLLRSVLDGSLSEDIYISDLVSNKTNYPNGAFFGDFSNRKRSLFINMVVLTSGKYYFLQGSKNIDIAHIVFDAHISMPQFTVADFFKGMPDLEHVELEFGTGLTSVTVNAAFTNLPKLRTCILRHHNANGSLVFASNVFGGGGNTLDTLVLDTPFLCTMSNVSAMDTTNFKNGGAGGTIYIPESLYSHLGDGTAMDYKAATNWSTLDGYGTVTWAKIEGSEYES